MNASEQWIWAEWKWLREEYSEASLICDLYDAPETAADGTTLSLAERIGALVLTELKENISK